MEDTKKVQTLINIVGKAAARMRADRYIMLAVRAAYVAADVDPTGTPLEGHVAAMNAALTTLDDALDSVVWTTLIDAVVPTHRAAALEV